MKIVPFTASPSVDYGAAIPEKIFTWVGEMPTCLWGEFFNDCRKNWEVDGQYESKVGADPKKISMAIALMPDGIHQMNESFEGIVDTSDNPLFIIWWIVAFVFLGIAVQIGYGPF